MSWTCGHVFSGIWLGSIHATIQTNICRRIPPSIRKSDQDVVSKQVNYTRVLFWPTHGYRRAKDKKIRSMTTLCSSSTELLPSSSSPILSPVPSAASSSSSSPSLSAPIQPQPQPDPIPSLIELLALGKSERIPISQLMSAINPALPPSQQ